MPFPRRHRLQLLEGRDLTPTRHTATVAPRVRQAREVHRCPPDTGSPRAIALARQWVILNARPSRSSGGPANPNLCSRRKGTGRKPRQPAGPSAGRLRQLARARQLADHRDRSYSVAGRRPNTLAGYVRAAENVAVFAAQTARERPGAGRNIAQGTSARVTGLATCTHRGGVRFDEPLQQPILRHTRCLRVAQVMGRFGWRWRVMDSNQRRLCRRFSRAIHDRPVTCTDAARARVSPHSRRGRSGSFGDGRERPAIALGGLLERLGP